VNSSAESGKEHDVFLSYTGVDKEWVRALGERLEQEGIDEQKGSRRIKVFFDEWGPRQCRIRRKKDGETDECDQQRQNNET